MKFLLVYIILFGIILVSCVPIPVHADVVNQIIPPCPTTHNWYDWMLWCIPVLVLIYDVLMRLIPTLKDYTLINNIGRMLDYLSKQINGIGNAAKPDANQNSEVLYKHEITKVTV